MGVTVVSQYRHVFPTAITFHLPPMLNSAENVSTILELYSLDGQASLMGGDSVSCVATYFGLPEINISNTLAVECDVTYGFAFFEPETSFSNVYDFIEGYIFAQRVDWEFKASDSIRVYTHALVDASKLHAVSVETDSLLMQESYIDQPYTSRFDVSAQTIVGIFSLSNSPKQEVLANYRFEDIWSYSAKGHSLLPNFNLPSNFNASTFRDYDIKDPTSDFSLGKYWAYGFDVTFNANMFSLGGEISASSFRDYLISDALVDSSIDKYFAYSSDLISSLSAEGIQSDKTINEMGKGYVIVKGEADVDSFNLTGNNEAFMTLEYDAVTDYLRSNITIKSYSYESSAPFVEPEYINSINTYVQFEITVHPEFSYDVLNADLVPCNVSDCDTEVPDYLNVVTSSCNEVECLTDYFGADIRTSVDSEVESRALLELLDPNMSATLKVAYTQFSQSPSNSFIIGNGAVDAHIETVRIYDKVCVIDISDPVKFNYEIPEVYLASESTGNCISELYLIDGNGSAQVSAFKFAETLTDLVTNGAVVSNIAIPSTFTSFESDVPSVEWIHTPLTDYHESDIKAHVSLSAECVGRFE